MAIKVFADGANLEGMLDMYENGSVQGFTTNPSLMKKGGVTDYRAFAKEVLAHITDVSVSFEVFADDVETMEVEVREIATWADNVYVKIPCVTTKGESTAELVRKLSADGIKVNVTTIFTPEQVDEMVEAVDAETPSIISLFAGRIADTGVDPIPFMTESVKKAAAKPNCEVLWASTRELINIYQAEACGCQIITVPNSILAKRKNVGRDSYEVSLDTVRGFAKDIASLGFHILPQGECWLRRGLFAPAFPFPIAHALREGRARQRKGRGCRHRLADKLAFGFHVLPWARYPRLRRAKSRVFSRVKAFTS